MHVPMNVKFNYLFKIKKQKKIWAEIFKTVWIPFYKYITMHGPMNVKFKIFLDSETEKVFGRNVSKLYEFLSDRVSYVSTQFH